MKNIPKKNEKLNYEVMSLLAADTLPASFALLVITSLITAVFWESTHKTFLFFWTFFIYIIIFARILLARYFLQKKLQMPLRKIEFIYSAVTITIAMSISFGIIFLFQNTDILHQTFLIMVVAGTSAGAVMSLSYFKNLLRLYLIILILPLATVLYMQESELLSSLSYLVFLFLFMLLIFATRYNKNIINTLKAKYQIIKTKKALEVSKNNFESIFNEVPIGVFTYDKNLVIHNFNKAFSDLLKAPKEKLKHLDMHTLKDQSLTEHFLKVFDHQKGYYQGIYNKCQTRINDIFQKHKERFHARQKVVGLTG
jgi:PAS domain-containing protein